MSAILQSGTIALGTAEVHPFPWRMSPSTLPPLPGSDKPRDSYTLTRLGVEEGWSPDTSHVKSCNHCKAAMTTQTMHPLGGTLPELLGSQGALAIHYKGPPLHDACWMLQEDGSVALRMPETKISGGIRHGTLAIFTPWDHGSEPIKQAWLSGQTHHGFGDAGSGKPLFWAIQSFGGAWAPLADKSKHHNTMPNCGEDVWADETPGWGLSIPVSAVFGLPPYTILRHRPVDLTAVIAERFDLATPASFAKGVNWMADQASLVLAAIKTTGKVPVDCDFGSMKPEQILAAAEAWARLKDIVYVASGNIDSTEFFNAIADGKFVLGEGTSTVHDIMAHWYFFMLAPKTHAMLVQCLRYERDLQNDYLSDPDADDFAERKSICNARIDILSGKADLITGRFGYLAQDKLCTAGHLRPFAAGAEETIKTLVEAIGQWTRDDDPINPEGACPTYEKIQKTYQEEYDSVLQASRMLNDFAAGLPALRIITRPETPPRIIRNLSHIASDGDFQLRESLSYLEKPSIETWVDLTVQPRWFQDLIAYRSA